jgi:hypothetical protein
MDDDYASDDDDDDDSSDDEDYESVDEDSAWAAELLALANARLRKLRDSLFEPDESTVRLNRCRDPPEDMFEDCVVYQPKNGDYNNLHALLLGLAIIHRKFDRLNGYECTVVRLLSNKGFFVISPGLDLRKSTRLFPITRATLMFFTLAISMSRPI